jgi:hypothetical protein
MCEWVLHRDALCDVPESVLGQWCRAVLRERSVLPQRRRGYRESRRVRGVRVRELAHHDRRPQRRRDPVVREGAPGPLAPTAPDPGRHWRPGLLHVPGGFLSWIGIPNNEAIGIEVAAYPPVVQTPRGRPYRIANN